MRMISNGAALAALLALVLVAALYAGGAAAPAFARASVEKTVGDKISGIKTPGGKFADRMPTILPAAATTAGIR